MARIVSKLLKNLTPTEKRQVWSLNFGPRGDMFLELSNWKHDFRPPRFRAVMLKDGERILSWALVMPPATSYTVRDDADTNVFVYTRVAERRKGYGTRVINNVQRKHGAIRVHPHDPTSRLFFRTFPIEHVDRKWIHNGSR